MTSEDPNAPRRQDGETVSPQNKSAEKIDGTLHNSANASTCCHKGTPRWKQILEAIAVASGVFYAVVTWVQWRDAHHNFRIDERAWVSIVPPQSYSVDQNGHIVVIAQVHNSGKTPARLVEGKVIGTIWKQGEDPDFAVEPKPPYSAVHSPALFPNVPLTVGFQVLRYASDSGVPISPQEIADGKAYIIVYGPISFDDIFGGHHWTHFCVSYPIPTKKCVQYNDTDGN